MTKSRKQGAPPILGVPYPESPYTKFVAHVEQHNKEVRATMTPTQRAIAEESDHVLEELNNDIYNFESENRIRQAGFTPQQAEDIAFIIQKKQVGEIFEYRGKQLVLTPFKTVVPAQTYVTALQDRLLQVTTVSAEIEIANLRNVINEFNSLSFLGLIGLALKRQYINLKNRIKEFRK